MITPEAFDEELREMILSIYIRPHMHATPMCIELVLWHVHEVWALLNEKEQDFHGLCNAQNAAACRDGSLYEFVVRQHPHANEYDVFRFVFSKWSAISQALGLHIPDSWEHIESRMSLAPPTVGDGPKED